MNQITCGCPCHLRPYPIGETNAITYYYYYQMLYLMGDEKSTTFHLLNTDGTAQLPTETVGHNLGDVEDTLVPWFMKRVHQSFIINALYIQSYERNGHIILRHMNEQTIPIGKTYKKPFYEWLKERHLLPYFPKKKPDFPPNPPDITLPQ